MAYRDGRAAYQALDEVSKIKGVARRTGYYEVKNKKGEWHTTLGSELATGERAEKIKRARKIGTGVGGAVGFLGAGVPATIVAGPIAGLGVGVPAGALGALTGYSIGDEHGWNKARGISGKKTNLYATPRARKKGIKEYLETGERPKSGSRQRKEVIYGNGPGQQRLFAEASYGEGPAFDTERPKDYDEDAAWF